MLRSRSVFAACLVAAAIVLAGPARAEYQCVPGTPIPGGPVLATYTIAAPGCYWLAADRTMTGGGPAIRINASHVFLDLRGHTVRHAVAGATIISNGVPLSDLHIANGKLTGASGGFGILLTGNGNGDINVSDITISDQNSAALPNIGILISGAGVAAPAHAILERNVIDVARDGIALDAVHGGRVRDNVLIGRPNPGVPSNGIRLNNSSGNDIRGNTITAIDGGGAGLGTAILIGNNSNYNNVQHNTMSACWEGIVVDASRCNVLDWNVSQGNINSSIRLTPTTFGTIYSFNRGAGTCTVSGIGLVDLGVNTNAGNNF